MQYLARSFLTLLAFCSPVLADSPSTPGALRVEVYSDTAAELFWQRSTDDGLVLAYEIALNDSIIDTLDALSHFRDDLQADVRYEVAVTAIDNEGNRSTPATLSFVGGERDQVGDGAPLPPANLRASIYSGSALELFWDRVTGTVLSYEIRIDGAIIGTTNGTSFFIDSLLPGREYVLDAVALDSGGNRSSASTVVARTNGGSNSGGAERPVAPQNARIIVYSATAAELFWDRAPDSEQVSQTRVLRDGVEIGVTEGISFFDDTRAPGTRFRYELIAVNTAGVESSASVVGASDGPDTGTVATINVDNHVELLSAIFDLFTGNSYRDEVLMLPGYSDTTVDAENVFPFSVEESIVCSNGGTATFTPGGPSGFNVMTTSLTFQFDNCQDGATLLEGELIQTRRQDGLVKIESTGFTAVSQSEQIQYSGSAESLLRGPFKNWSTDDVNYRVTTPSNTFELNGSTDFRDGLFSAAMIGSYTIRSAPTGSELLQVRIIDDFIFSVLPGTPGFSFDDNLSFMTGTLEVVAEDGSQLVLSAENGDLRTVSINISNNGDSESLTQPWSLWLNNLRLPEEF